MKVTKYEHACLVVEKDGKSIIVDPGDFTTDFSMPDNVVAIIITHVHNDHLGEEHIFDIMDDYPNAMIVGPSDVTKQFGQYDTRPVKGGDSFALEGIDLDFYGDDHATIHPDIPKAQNVGVLIDDRLYYPGDSFTIPEKSVDTLALPVSAPWLKVSESIEFMKTINARLTFPTHDAILSNAGKGIFDRMVGMFADAANTDYKRLDGETIEIE